MVQYALLTDFIEHPSTSSPYIHSPYSWTMLRFRCNIRTSDEDGSYVAKSTTSGSDSGSYHWYKRGSFRTMASLATSMEAP